jgi:hypothetical protein
VQRPRIRTRGSALLPMALFALAAGASADDAERYRLTPDEHGMVLKRPDGETVLRYMTRKPEDSGLTANSVCCLYPVFTPSGERAVEFAPEDHRHHRGVYLAWHAMTVGDQRADFWGWGARAPTEERVIRNRSVELANADADHAQIQVRNDWMIGEQVAVEEQLTIVARLQGDAYVIDLDFQLTPAADLELDQTAFGGFCVRGRRSPEAVVYDPQGRVDRPNPHHLKPETNWPPAAWYGYEARLDNGQILGTAIVNHPENPPTTWHNIAALGMINPCIAAPAAVQRKAGEPLRLRYRLVVHDGPRPIELLNKELRAGS